jgi:hypothetical protein
VRVAPWAYIRAAIVAIAFLGGVFGRFAEEGAALPYAKLLPAAFTFGVIGMIFVVGIQRFNSRSAPTWRYPAWGANPFTMREPLQFFHLGGYFVLASGVGALVHRVVDESIPLFEPLLFVSVGAGVIVGVRLCTVVFRSKMART